MKKILYVLMAIVLVTTFTLGNTVVAAALPRLGISTPSSGTVQVGGTISYNVMIFNNPTSVTLKASDIRIAGVNANISVSGSGNTRTITLSNIQGSVGSVGYISYIAGGVAVNEVGGSVEMNITSASFTIVATPAPEPAPQPQNNGGNTNTNTLPPQTNTNINTNNNTETPTPEQEEDKEAPKMEVENFSSQSIQKGDSLSFKVKYSDNKEMGDITLNNNDIKLFGFTADIEITGDGSERTVTLKNIQGDLGGLKYVKIADNTAKDKAGNSVGEGKQTGMFKIVNNDTKNNPDDWIENPNTGR